MGCFRCFGSKKNDSNEGTAAQSHHTNKWGLDRPKSRGKNDPKKEPGIPKDGPTSHIAPRTFTFRELAIATQNFGRGSLLGKGGSGRVYKGQLANGQVVAVKRLDRNALQGNKEFLVVALMLSLLHHPNLVNLIGYCADGDKRLLVYEFMPLGSLEDHLHKRPPNKEPLDWNTRMKIAAGAAKGLEYLHNEANPPVIYRDLKSSNILFDEGFHPKLSDFGLAKMGPAGDKTHVSTRVMGTYGYCAPEYAMTGQLTLKSDVYSLGVVFLELITGRKAIDNARDRGEHNLVAWARPLFKDKRKFSKMADPLLQGQYPMRSLYQALAVVAMCLREQAATRPLIGDVVATFTYLASQTYDRNEPSSQSNKVGSSTPRHKEDCRKSVDSWDEPRRGGHGSPSSYKDSPDYRRTETGKEFSNKAPLRKTLINRDLYRERAVAEAKEWGDNWRRKKLNATGSFDGSDESEHAESQKGSPASAGARETPRNRDLRERAVAEAKVWGDNWRRKKLNATGSFDGSDESEHADSQKGSPASARARETPRNRDLRERAVAEAKVWGDNWRRKKLNATDSFDGTNE